MGVKTYIDALQEVLSKHYEKDEYSLDGYQECAVCLSYNEDGWVVYDGERGARNNPVYCDTIVQACMQVIRKLTTIREDIDLMEYELFESYKKIA